MSAINIQARPTPRLYEKRGTLSGVRLSELVSEIGFNGSYKELLELVLEAGFVGSQKELTELVLESGFVGSQKELTELVLEVGFADTSPSFRTYVPIISF
jgi:hypothetical protein